jgi:hypothetical protein
MRSPARLPDRLCWNNAEATVVGRVAEQPHQRLAERVGRTKNRVHQSSTDTKSPAVRENSQRPETKSWLGTDMGTLSYNVADHQVALDRDQRQLQNPTSICSQPRDQQRRFARIPSWLHWRCAVLPIDEPEPLGFSVAKPHLTSAPIGDVSGGRSGTIERFTAGRTGKTRSSQGPEERSTCRSDV